jgi:hypothetical protein
LETSITDPQGETTIRKNAAIIWKQIEAFDDFPIYPAIVQEVFVTAKEEEYIDHDLDYEEKHTEWLELRRRFILAHFEQDDQLLGVGDCVILGIGKHDRLRAPRVIR